MNLQVLAFGAGTQSTALAVLALTGDQRLLDVAPPLDLMVFADPGSESAATYSLVDLVEKMSQDARIPFYRAVYSGSRRPRLADSLARDSGIDSIPMFTKGAGVGQLMRACTRAYKIRPVATAIRRHLGVRRVLGRDVVDVWLGISTDEAHRAKPEKEMKWQRRVFPLLDLQWKRSDCARYLEEALDVTVGRSACVFCPFHSDDEWARLHEEGGADWEHAVEVDESIRDMGGRGRIRSACYLHRSCRPLAELPFLDSSGQASLWGGECEGMCGL